MFRWHYGKADRISDTAWIKVAGIALKGFGETGKAWQKGKDWFGMSKVEVAKVTDVKDIAQEISGSLKDATCHFDDGLRAWRVHYTLPGICKKLRAGAVQSLHSGLSPYNLPCEDQTDDSTRNVSRWPRYSFPAPYLEPKNGWTTTVLKICAVGI